MLIYVPKINTRVSYILEFIFCTILQLDFRLTEDKEEFISSAAAKINYSGARFGDELFFRKHDFIDSPYTADFNIEFIMYEGCSVPFPVHSSSLPFDVFSASFFLLTRWEEYNSTELDKHGRFRAESSMAFKNNFLERPVIDEWAFAIKNILVQRFPVLSVPQRKFHFLPTFDIDRSYAFKYSSLLRNSLRVAKATFTGKFGRAKQILNVLAGRVADPFDTHQQIKYLHAGCSKPLIFLLLGDRDKYSPNLSWRLPATKKLIDDLLQFADIGIHPSYGSNFDEEILNKEIDRLSKLSGQPVTRSRQHFLKMQIPETYHQLLQAGIREDYTMGYASKVGFRAGTCTPHYWFDLTCDQKTALMLIPFAAMDATLNRYMNLEPLQALKKLKDLCNSVKTVEGQFCLLWHNESLSEINDWENWGTVYREILQHLN